MERIMAIDYGEKRIGIALTDPLLTFAYPYKTIINDAGTFTLINEIIREMGVTSLIIGLPLNADGSEKEITLRVRKFGENIEKLTGLKPGFYDERYSSSIAQERIISSVSKKSKRRDKGLVDMNAAAVILEDYLREIK